MEEFYGEKSEREEPGSDHQQSNLLNHQKEDDKMLNTGTGKRGREQETSVPQLLQIRWL